MFARLRGVIAMLSEDHVVLDVGGIGYLVHASQTVLRNLHQDEEITMLIETIVKEDAITLIGFLKEEERHWYKLLTSVQGVGTKAALAILSDLGIEGLNDAIANQDKAMITRAQGVGPKLGLRILTELRDKAQAVIRQVKPSAAFTTASSDIRSPINDNPASKDVYSALVNLGFKPQAAQQALKVALEQQPDAQLETLLKTALQVINSTQSASS